MTDDLTKRRPQDARKVNVNEPYEVRWWCSEFGVTETQLRTAVTAVGVEAGNVAKRLGKRWPK
ncbi:DUF3606 domain-containing protein [Rhizobium leguminosarum]|uniref:DUF3606 domain-containing protein n=1 Tax=Rhizobium leguminosarum TaxID=384 RepID=A0A7K3VD71_RHILE|nr:DUF3606 domain-containing protein [Rhizobium leguminosarum]NEK15046.1 DUF3606 domain-containing protein [Rhizobium leguminosarum]